MTRSESSAADWRRLHPLSWLFVLLTSLREFALPLIALVFFGRSDEDGWEFIGAIGALIVAVIAFVRYLSYRYAVIGNELVIRQGILSRNVRHVPLARIQNVALHRNVLHRIFGVAEVQLESAAGVAPEAVMRVLSLRQAADLEALIREHRRAAQTEGGDLAPPEAETETALVRLGPGEIIRLGLISNRGLVVVAGAFGVLSQTRPDGISRRFGNAVEAVIGEASAWHTGPLGWLLGGALLLAAFVVVLRLLSVLMAFLQFHDFRLDDGGDRLRVESGLLTRVRASALKRRIQHWTVTETWLHRLFDRQSLKVETAVTQAANQSERGLSHLLPVGTPEAVTALMQRLLPQAHWPNLRWRPLHPAAWRRMVKPPLLLLLLACAGLAMGPAGSWAFVGLGLAPLLLLSARGRGRFGGWYEDGQIMAYRSGWLDRRWSVVEIRRLQGVQFLQNGFDRRWSMAGVAVDTAGANPMGHRIHIRYLPEREARALYSRLCRLIERPTPARMPATAAPAR